MFSTRYMFTSRCTCTVCVIFTENSAQQNKPTRHKKKVTTSCLISLATRFPSPDTGQDSHLKRHGNQQSIFLEQITSSNKEKKGLFLTELYSYVILTTGNCGLYKGPFLFSFYSLCLPDIL